jgi:hypothetical protein
MIWVCLVWDSSSDFSEGFFLHGVGRKMPLTAEVIETIWILCVGYFLHLIQSTSVRRNACYNE